MNTLNYTPKIVSLSTIKNSDTKQNDTDTWIQESDYELYHNTCSNFYDGLTCKEHGRNATKWPQ